MSDGRNEKALAEVKAKEAKKEKETFMAALKTFMDVCKSLKCRTLYPQLGAMVMNDVQETFDLKTRVVPEYKIEISPLTEDELKRKQAQLDAMKMAQEAAANTAKAAKETGVEPKTAQPAVETPAEPAVETPAEPAVETPVSAPVEDGAAKTEDKIATDDEENKENKEVEVAAQETAPVEPETKPE